MHRQLEGTVAADDPLPDLRQQGASQAGQEEVVGTPGQDHDDKDRPAIIAWVSRQGTVVIQATRDFTVKTLQKAAEIAVRTGSRLSTDSASSYRTVKGYVHAFVNQTQKEYAR
jgi:hypothetical protein